MVLGFLKAGSALAVISASLALAMPASAADYGGDCCADLEERVAELEATAVKHANRKVSMTIGGSITEAILLWDHNDLPGGAASGRAIVSTGGGFTISGDGKLNSDVSVGYNIGINARIGKPNNLDGSVTVDDPATAIDETAATVKDLSIDTMSININSASMGKLSIGTAGDSYGAARIWNGVLVDDMAGLAVDTTRANAWKSIAVADGMLIRYDSPAVAGFVVGASINSEEFWAARIGWTGAFSGNTVALAAGIDKSESVTLSGKITNDASGLYVYGTQETWLEDSAYQIGAGWTKNVTGLGNTSVWGLYQSTTTSGRDLDVPPDGINDTHDTGTGYALGVTQDLDAVGASLFVRYGHRELEAINVYVDTTLAGMTVKF